MCETRRGVVKASGEAGLSPQHIGCAGAKPATRRSMRRGAVILIQAGDPEICEPIKSGMLAGRESRRRDLSCRGCAAPPSPEGEGLTTDPRRVVSAEMDRQAIREGLREAVGNTKTPADYAAMRCRAEIEWGEPVDYPTPLERFGDGLLAAYAMVICGLSAAFHAQDHILGG